VKSGFVFPILRHHHAQRGDAEDPPASETFCRPTSHCSSPCPPGSFRLVLRLTAPRTSPTRLRPLPWGGTTPPSPAPPDVSPHTARGWGGMAVRRPRLPNAPCWGPCAASLPVAASCTPARVCTRLSLVRAVPSCAPVSAAAPPQHLQRCKSFGISLFKLSSPL
jgi:hypothetical protein